jgi:hypothetical protein
MPAAELIRELRGIVGSPYVLIEKADVVVYEQDGSIFQVMPRLSLFLAMSRRSPQSSNVRSALILRSCRAAPGPD